MTENMTAKEIFDRLSPILHELEEMLLAKQHTVLTVTGKPDVGAQANVVTDADIASEKDFRQKLPKAFPDTGILAEEKGADLKNGYNWIIDPIDGTASYANDLRLWGVSISLWGPNGPVFGCIMLPGEKLWLWGGTGQGVWLSDKTSNTRVPIYEQKPVSPKKIVSLAPIFRTAQEDGDVHRGLAEAVGHTRDYGCSTWQSVMVFLGKSDAVVHYRLSIWDIGAAVLLAKELGLTVQYVGEEPNLADPDLAKKSYTLVFGHPDLVPKITQALASLNV